MKRLFIFTLPWLAGLALAAVSAAPPKGPEIREFWVPQQHLAKVLQTSPKAVLLSKAQLEVLLRDSRPRHVEEIPAPPVPAVLRSAHYQGTPGDRFVTMQAQFSVECLTDGWSTVPLELQPRWLGTVTVDGTSAVQVTGDANQPPSSVQLVVQGKGRHDLTLNFAVPVRDESGRRSLEMMAPGASEATLTLGIPDKVKFESIEPFTHGKAEAVFALPAQRRMFRISWSKQDLAPLETAAVLQECKMNYLIDPVRLEAELDLSWHSPLRPLPAQVTLPLPPGVTVLGLDGPEVNRWTLAGDRLVVDFQPGNRKDAALNLTLEQALEFPADGRAVKLSLPSPVAEGVLRTSGQFSLYPSRGLRVRQVLAGDLAGRDDSRTPGKVGVDGFGTWVFPVLPAPPVVELEQLQVQFTATLDTQIFLKREAVHLTRWLTLTPRDGTLFSPKLEGLMPSEEIESVKAPDGTEPVWQKTETGLVFPDNRGIPNGKPWTLIITTRLDPAGWQGMTEQALALTLGSAKIPGAARINGYVALDFEDALLVTTNSATGLETRDPRQFTGVLPIKGRMAWSRLEDFQLDLKIARRAPEYEAAVVLYALPLLNSLEVEGALNLNIDRSPVREVRVIFPAEAAAAVRWDSPLLAESLLEADHTWRLRFHQETDGAPSLRFRLSLPLTDSTDATTPVKASATAAERRFTVTPPLPAMPGARRLSGTLMVEANTDTELSFAATGLNAMDTLRVPALDGYMPRHRLVSAWTWLGGSPALTVNGVRHQPGELISTVVDKLKLDTVISQDGLIRHQAGMEVRTAGDQYLDVVLPESARVLTLLVNLEAVKPVRNHLGGLRVPLSGNAAVIRLICECPGEPMSSAARRKLVPVTPDPALPVLETTWQLHLPDGFSYDSFAGNLTQTLDSNPATPGVLGLAMTEMSPGYGKIMAGTARQDSDVTKQMSSRHAGKSAPAAASLPAPAPVAFADFASTKKNLVSRTFAVPPDFLSRGASAPSQGLAKKPDAKSVLTQLGIQFDDGATAAFSADGSTLTVRNNEEELRNLDQVVGVLQKTGPVTNGGFSDPLTQEAKSDRAGLLPLNFNLPEGGKVYLFTGQYAPAALEFEYESWERQMQWSWLWMIAGAVVFWRIAKRSPRFWCILGVLLLHFIPEVFALPEWLPMANALMIGWVSGGMLKVIAWAMRRKPEANPALLVPAQTAFMIMGLIFAAGLKGQAEETSQPSQSEVPVVIVPYNPAYPVGVNVPDRRYLNYETFQTLWAAAKQNRRADAAKTAADSAKGEPRATLTSALHRASVDGTVLRVETVIAVQTRGADWVKVPFLLPDGVRHLTLDGSPAALQGGQLLVEKAGNHVVLAAYDVPLPAGWQEVAWDVPAASANALALSLAMSDPARPEVNEGAPLVEAEDAGRRVFTATLGSTNRITLKRRTAAERSGGQAENPPLAKVQTRVYVTPALERVESALEFVFIGQSRSQFVVRMEAGLTPVSFSVPGLENWMLRQEAGMQVLELRLERPVAETFSLNLVAERMPGKLPLTEKAPDISAAAGRVEREWSMLVTDDLEARPETLAGHQRVDFVKAPGTGDEGFDAVGTWQASGTAGLPGWELSTKIPEGSAVVHYAFQPGGGKLELSAGMELRPAPGRELRELTIQVPEGVTIQGVTGDRLADWWHEAAALQIRFTPGDQEVTRLALNLTQPLPADAREVSFSPLQIGGFSKVSGSGLLIAPVNQDAVLRLTPGGPALREVAPEETKSGFTIRRPLEEKRGFLFEGTAWTATAKLTQLEARYDVDWVLDAEVRDSWLALNTRVLVSLTRGGLERLSFTTPASAPEFRITGEDVRETTSVVEGPVRRYTISFQALMTGAALFTITGQVPHQGKSGLPDIDFTGAARTARFVIVDNRSEGKMGLTMKGCAVTPRGQLSFLPEELANGQSGAQFYEARPGWSMEISVEKLETTAGQAAVVLHADLTTSILKNGEVWQQAVYVVQNRALQFLPVRLPAHVEVISVVVGGEATRADRGVVDGNAVFLVPLIQTSAGDLAMEVKLIFRRRSESGHFPQVLEDPDLPGIPVSQTFWSVQYPDGYQLEADGGNMTSTDDSESSAGKAFSRLSELVTLRKIAKSDKYDKMTQMTARGNAQAILSDFGQGKLEGLDEEITAALEETRKDVIAPEEQGQTALPRNQSEGGLKVKEFRYNNKSQAEVEAPGKTTLKPADGLTLNDNVAWASENEDKPAMGNLNNVPEVAKRRISQFNKLERGKGADEKPAPPGKDALKQTSKESKEDEFNDLNGNFSFQNGRLNNVGDNYSLLNSPATTSAAPAAPGAAKPADFSQQAAPDSFATQPADSAAAASAAAAPETPRLRTTGRSSLEAVFPTQRNAAHFRKVKGDAMLQLNLSRPWLGQIKVGSGAVLALCLGALFLTRMLHKGFFQAKQTEA